MKRRYTKEQTEQWIERHFVVCKCGYRNEINRFQKYGVCLSCGRILDDRLYFKSMFYKTKRKLRKRGNYGKNN